MAVTSGFFNSINGDRRYDARQISRYLGSLVGSGVFPNPSTNLQVVASEGMAVRVSPGRAFLDCYWMENDSMYTVVLDDADMVLDRIDAVIMRLDENDDARSIDIIVKKGTPSSTPQAPGMERGDKIKEYCLATVTVRKMRDDGTQGITQADITDTRADTDVCGWVTGLIDQVDTHTLFLQWQAAYQQFYAASGAEFDAWMEELHAILEGDAVSNIMSAIEENATAIQRVAQELEKKPDTPIVVQATITAAGWTGEDVPYENILTVEGVTAGSIVEVTLQACPTEEQVTACAGAMLVDGGQADGSITLRAMGDKPEVDIPITVIIR